MPGQRIKDHRPDSLEPTEGWGGIWSGATYNSGPDTTTFTGNFGTPVGGGALGDSVKPGMVVIPDLLKAVPLHIESVSINLLGSDTLTVKGDATGLGGNGTRFRIHQHAPYKYDLTDELRRNTPCDLGARYLWSSYRRIPWTWSRAGEDPYLAWNRVYLPEIGRWTSTDPLAAPWTSLFDYSATDPITEYDPSGLKVAADVTGSTGTAAHEIKSSCGNFTFDVTAVWQATKPKWYSGIDVTISFTPHSKAKRKADKCLKKSGCSNIRILQSVVTRKWDDSTDGWVEAGVQGKFNKNVHKADNGEHNDVTGSNWWYTGGTPEFGDATVEPPKAAKITDAPSVSFSTNPDPRWFDSYPRYRTSFLTCAICDSGQAKEEYFGCFDWEWEITDNGTTKWSLWKLGWTGTGYSASQFNNFKFRKAWNDNEAKDIPEAKPCG